MRLRYRLPSLVSAVLIPILATRPASAGEFAPAQPVQGMAIARPDPGMANGVPVPDTAGRAPDPPASDPAQGRRRFEMLGTGLPSTGGRLPNQRTGPRREHVVHDICIGC